MLSIFPQLFTYTLFAPLLLRIIVGGYFILFGIRRMKEDSTSWNELWSNKKIGPVPLAPTLAKLQILIGAFIFVGLFTQVTVIIAILFVWAEWFKRNRTARLSFQELWVFIFITTICLALLILGAGIMAFDLPL